MPHGHFSSDRLMTFSTDNCTMWDGGCVFALLFSLCLRRVRILQKLCNRTCWRLIHIHENYEITLLCTYASTCVHSFHLTTSESMRKFYIKSLVQFAVSFVTSNFVRFSFHFWFCLYFSPSVDFVWKQDMYKYIVHTHRWISNSP